jgi:hypothetical protein
MYIGGAIVVVIAVVALIGATLPVAHKASRRMRFRQPPTALYAVLAGPPDWRSDVKGSGELAAVDGKRRWWEEDGRGKKITYELVEDRAPSRRVTRIADQSLPYGGTWTFDITPAGEGSELRITEDGEVYNVIFRFMARFVFGYTGSINGVLRDLSKKFGEEPRIEA